LEEVEGVFAFVLGKCDEGIGEEGKGGEAGEEMGIGPQAATEFSVGSGFSDNEIIAPPTRLI